MAHVEVRRREPKPPPVEKVLLDLQEHEARHVMYALRRNHLNAGHAQTREMCNDIACGVARALEASGIEEAGNG